LNVSLEVARVVPGGPAPCGETIGNPAYGHSRPGAQLPSQFNFDLTRVDEIS